LRFGLEQSLISTQHEAMMSIDSELCSEWVMDKKNRINISIGEKTGVTSGIFGADQG
jgi:hypothetical protein